MKDRKGSMRAYGFKKLTKILSAFLLFSGGFEVDWCLGLRYYSAQGAVSRFRYSLFGNPKP